jgi:argonaute-like protein implicated in RNA metabolism and viral defense
MQSNHIHISKMTKHIERLSEDTESRRKRRFKQLFAGYLKVAGDQHDSLCRQLASLVLQSELLQRAQLGGKEVDTELLVRLNSAINRTVRRLDFIKAQRDEQGDGSMLAHLRQLELEEAGDD